MNLFHTTLFEKYVDPKLKMSIYGFVQIHASTLGLIYIALSEYDQSRIFDIRPNLKFSFKKIRPSAKV